MMRSLQMKRWLATVMIPVLGAVTPSWAWAAGKKAAAAKSEQSGSRQQEAVDSIAAVVNKSVITTGQLNTEVKMTQAQLRQQKIAVPPDDILRKQVLQRMITDELIRQEADRRRITVDDAQLQRAVDSIAQRNKISVDRLRQEVTKTGISWDDYLKNLRQEVRLDMLRQRAVDSTILITDADVDAFLKSQERLGNAGMPSASPASAEPAPQAAGPQVLGLAQILVAVPEAAPQSKVDELRRKAEAILDRLRKGADFASVAAASSDGPQALKGGDMGVRPVQGWPDLFIQATQSLGVGGVSGIIQSGQGFHILKVVTRGPAQAPAPSTAPTAPQAAPAVAEPSGPMMVTQTHVRHILIKVNKGMTDERARERLQQVRQRIEMGESFSDLAKRYSEDTSAPLGGELGWVNPGDTVPAFEQAMNALQPGQISQPVRTQFGWHLIQVEDRRNKDMGSEYKRLQARQILFQRRAEPAFEDWLNQLYGQAYIDNRLDPESNRRPRR